MPGWLSPAYLQPSTPSASRNQWMNRGAMEEDGGGSAMDRIARFLSQEQVAGLDSAAQNGGRQFINGRWYVNEAPMNGAGGGAGGGSGGGEGGGGGGFGSISGIRPGYRDPATFFPDRSGDRSSRLARTLQDMQAGFRGVHAYNDPRTLSQAPGGVLNDFNEVSLRAGMQPGNAADGQLRARLEAQMGSNVGATNRSEFIQGEEMQRRRLEVIDQLRAMLEGGRMGADLQFGQFGLASQMLPYQQLMSLANIFNNVQFEGGTQGSTSRYSY